MIEKGPPHPIISITVSQPNALLYWARVSSINHYDYVCVDLLRLFGKPLDKLVVNGEMPVVLKVSATSSSLK